MELFTQVNIFLSIVLLIVGIIFYVRNKEEKHATTNPETEQKNTVELPIKPSRPTSTASSRRNSTSSTRSTTSTQHQDNISSDVKTKKKKEGYAYQKVPLLPQKKKSKKQKTDQGQIVVEKPIDFNDKPKVC